MKDKGIDKGLIREFNTSARPKGVFRGIFGFRKMFWDYFNKLHVLFSDPCCDVAQTNPELVPSGFNTETGEFVFWDVATESWLTQNDWVASTTTTTTAASTTTTTTV